MSKVKCKSTSVRVHNKLRVNDDGIPNKDGEHSGSVSHVCKFDQGHEPPCECVHCGIRWIKFKTVA